MTTEKIGNITTTPEYWDCECRNNYIHPITEKSCPLCGAISDNQPDSIVSEVEAYLEQTKKK